MQWTSQQGIEKCDKYSGYGPGTSFGAPSALTRPGLLLTMDPANPQASEERGLLGNDWVRLQNARTLLLSLTLTEL